MFAELRKVMDHGLDNDDYIDALKQNVFNKATKSGISYTSQYLKKLYDFDILQPAFKAFKHFWKISNDHERPILAFLYAITNDYLLRESIPIKSLFSGTTISEYNVRLRTLHAKHKMPPEPT